MCLLRLQRRAAKGIASRTFIDLHGVRNPGDRAAQDGLAVSIDNRRANQIALHEWVVV